MNKLALYLKTTGTTQAELAGRVGVDQSTISRLVRGKLPNMPLAAQIEEATNGEVGISDWMPDRSMQSPRKPSVKHDHGLPRERGAA